MNKKIKIITSIFIVIILFLVSIFISKNEKQNIAIQVDSNVNLSNTKIEWGIKRGKEHKQPELGKKNKELIEKYNGFAMGNSESKNVYLTFDLGYEAGYTERILDVLKDNNIKAAFFITAHYVNTASDTVKRMIDEGHIVGNHTVNHKSMPGLTEEQIKSELMNLHTAVYEKFRV